MRSEDQQGPSRCGCFVRFQLNILSIFHLSSAFDKVKVFGILRLLYCVVFFANSCVGFEVQFDQIYVKAFSNNI